MVSKARVSVFSESLTAAELCRLVGAEAHRTLSLGERIPPTNGKDVRNRIARHSSLAWSVDFAGDGSTQLAEFLDLLSIQWKQIEELGDHGPKWVVSVIFDSDSSGDQVIFDGRLLETLLRLSAEFYVKSV